MCCLWAYSALRWPATKGWPRARVRPRLRLAQDAGLNVERGILVDEFLQASRPDIFAAGDVRSKWERQISTAVGDGTVAAIAVERYLETLQNG